MTGPIIRKCWDEKFDGAKEVLEALVRLDAFMGDLEFKTDDDQLQAEVCIGGSGGKGTTILCTIPA